MASADANGRPRVDVLIASSDPNFLRLAGAVLSRAGHAVHTTTDRTTRVQRLVRLRTPQVLVIETAEGAAPQVYAMVAGFGVALGLVLVSDDTPTQAAVARYARGAGQFVPKWGPSEALVEAVERAAGTVPADPADRALDTPRPRLRLVQP